MRHLPPAHSEQMAEELPHLSANPRIDVIASLASYRRLAIEHTPVTSKKEVLSETSRPSERSEGRP
jgi:hypothetical protein